MAKINPNSVWKHWFLFPYRIVGVAMTRLPGSFNKYWSYYSSLLLFSLLNNYFLPKVINIWSPIFFMIGQVVNTIWYELLPFTLVYCNKGITFFTKIIYPVSTKTPIFFVTIGVQVCLNSCRTPWFGAENVWAVLNENALINFKPFFCWCLWSNESNYLS